MDHRISKDMISSGMTPSGEKAQEDLGRTQYGSTPSPSSLMEAYKTMYEHHQKDADGKVIEHEEEEVKEGKMPEGLKNYLMKKNGKKEDKKDDMKKEDADLFDLVKGKLIDEGYEEKDAVKIMANLTEDEFNQISEGLPMIAKAGMAVGGALLAKKGLGDMKKKFDNFLNKKRDSGIGGNTRPGSDKVYYGKQMIMIVTSADKSGNTLAWQRYKEGFKSRITGKPLYELAPHLKDS